MRRSGSVCPTQPEISLKNATSSQSMKIYLSLLHLRRRAVTRYLERYVLYLASIKVYCDEIFVYSQRLSNVFHRKQEMKKQLAFLTKTVISNVRSYKAMHFLMSKITNRLYCSATILNIFVKYHISSYSYSSNTKQSKFLLVYMSCMICSSVTKCQYIQFTPTMKG